MKLSGDIREPQSLTPHEKERMFALMTFHYDQIRPEKFLNDLSEKDGVLMLYDSVQEIQGFTSFLIIETFFKQEKVYALYSGDTIVDERYWGQLGLFQHFGSLLHQFFASHYKPLYWFLLTKGIRTYLLLPLFFKKFYPNHFSTTPAYEQDLLLHLSRLKFNGCDVNRGGLIRLQPGADRLQERFVSISEKKYRNPHIRFFIENNPGYTEGDELICLAKLSETNLKPTAKRFVYQDVKRET